MVKRGSHEEWKEIPTFTAVGSDFFLSALYLNISTMMILAGNTISDAYTPVINCVIVNSIGPS